MIILSEIVEPQGSFHEGTIIGAVTILCVSVILPFIREWMKDRRERENDKITQEYLKSIATTNKELADRQQSSNILLASHIAKTDERHAANLQIMATICKADCFKQQKQK